MTDDDVTVCPWCRQDVQLRATPSGVLRIVRHQISGSTPTQGDSCRGTGLEVIEQ